MSVYMRITNGSTVELLLYWIVELINCFHDATVCSFGC